MFPGPGIAQHCARMKTVIPFRLSSHPPCWAQKKSSVWGWQVFNTFPILASERMAQRGQRFRRNLTAVLFLPS